MCCGGPTIWLETRYEKIVAVYGTDRIERMYYDGVGLADLIVELAPYKQQKGQRNVK